MALIITCAPHAPAATATAAPVAVVKATLAEATTVYQNQKLPNAERTRQLHAIAAEHFDFAFMARDSLGIQWRRITPAQRKAFVPIFTNYVIDTFLGTLQHSTVEAVSHSVMGSATTTSPGYAEVHSTVKLPMLDQPLKVDYSLHHENGVWKIVDIFIDNVSQMGNYRRDFNAIVNKDGYAKLVTDLKNKNIPLRSPAQGSAS
ncbi:MAG: MlaC/ttg2D family ABC transporter substrate-binding protein [Candidatus Binataceae bacterium]